MFRPLLTYLRFALEIPGKHLIVNSSVGLLPGFSESNQAPARCLIRVNKPLICFVANPLGSEPTNVAMANKPESGRPGRKEE
jgi:hypothetical protein